MAAKMKVWIIRVVAPDGTEDVDVVADSYLDVYLYVDGQRYEGTYEDAPYWAEAFGFAAYTGCETISVPVTRWHRKDS